MSDAMRNAALSAVLNIFETMFFTFLEPVEGNPLSPEILPEPEKETGLIPQPQGPWFLKSEIHFSGAQTGQLQLVLPYDLGETLAMNFLGFEEEVSESQVLDMACELTNMICGNLFSVFDKTAVYTLGAPSIQKLSFPDEAPPAKPSDLVLYFSADGQPITLQIQFDPHQ